MVTMTLDEEALQSYLDRLACIPNQWQIKISVDNYKELHIRNNKSHVHCIIKGKQLYAVRKGKNLGITISNDLKSAEHCSEVVNTAKK